MKILLDPGHGSGKKHNRGFKQVEDLPYCNEGDCNYIYAAEYLKPALEKYGFTVGITRSAITQDPSLQARGAMGKGCDLLISCHSNAATGNVRGVEIWDSTNPRESIKSLTDSICGAVSKELKTPYRGTKYRRNSRGQNYYGILRHGQAKHNFIIEHVFHDNQEDATVYRKNLKRTAEAVADAIAAYFKLKPAAPAAPPPKAELTEDKFIQTIADTLSGQTLKILPSVTIAQAILESNWGRSELATGGNNLFGIKASPDWTGEVYRMMTKEQNSVGEIYTIEADFRKYRSYKESIKDHDDFFTSTPWRSNNYKRVLEAKEYKTQAQALQSCGYATDINYAKKLISLIERLGLQQYDKGVNKYVTTNNTEPSTWAKESWDWGKEKGITDGTNPRGSCTREQVIAMIKRYDKLKEEKK